MRTVLILADKEFRDGLRNRWVLAATLLLAALALGLALLGGAPAGGGMAASRLAVVVVSLASLSIFLVPLIALMLSYDALVGEAERGTLLLLLAYPVSRRQVVAGKLLGHAGLLAVAVVAGYGVAALALALLGEADAAGWRAFALLTASSVLLGAAFLGIGYVASGLVAERGTAAGLVVAAWLLFVLLFDLVLLAVLAAGEGRGVSPGLFAALLLLNPADVFRLLNLSAVPEVRTMAGLVGVAAPPVWVLLAALLAWVAGPVALAGWVFRRRPV